MSQPSVFSLNDYTDNNEQLLKAMGFDNEKEIKQALCMSNNDINEAVAILTNEKLPKIANLVSSSNDIENDIDMIDATCFQNDAKLNSNDQNDPLKFPLDALIQLENNVFTDNWSIPYKKDEWLERLLVSSIALLNENLAELDVNCKKFFYHVMPEVYKKLHDSIPVKNWGNEIQQGVYNMTMLALELIALRINQEGVPEVLLNTLTLIFNSDTTFHVKNMHRSLDTNLLDSFESFDLAYSKNIDTNGWLLDFINKFALLKGFDGIKNQLEKSNDMNEFNQLLKPIAMCSYFLNEKIILASFENSIRRIFEFIKSLVDDDFKDKNAGKVFDLILTIKKLCSNIWPQVMNEFNTLHLSTILNMLKYSHFNSKMNSLKEICKLIDDVTSSITISKVMIKEDELSEWIITEKVLSFAVEGNIDQSQYCEKIKTIVEFIGDRIKSEEINALWEMQFNKSMSIIDNLYNIIGIAATKFNQEQLDYLLIQIIETWNKNSFKLHDKLVGLLKIIGREAKSNKTCSRILEALWELRNRSGLTRSLLLLIHTEHLNVLNGGRLPRETAKREYLKKCCEDIKKAPGSSIAIASLRHLYEILKSYQKSSIKALKDVLTDLVVPIMKNLCLSLLKCHSNAYEKARLSNQKFDQTASIDGLFTHEEVVQSHLHSMKFILQEGNLYLNLNRAQDIWNTLITNEHSSEWDKKIGFEWFIDCLPDLSDDSRAEIFKKQILTLKPSKLSLKGYECFKLYFIRVNEHESKIQIKNDIDNLIVEKLDLLGLNFLWDIILYVNDESIADLGIKFFLEISFEKVSARIKRDLITLHQRFIKECYSKLESCLISLETSPIGQLLFDAFKISCLSVSLTEMENLPIAPRADTFKCIERLLMIAESYIIKVEESQAIQRTNLPHFLSFKSESFLLPIVYESQRQVQHLDLYVCSNETLGDLRVKIANALGIQPYNTQIYNNEKLLNVFQDQKLLIQLNIDGMCSLNIKTASTYPSSSNQTPVKDSCLNFTFRQDLELEKSFPGVLLANSNDGSAFDMLHRLEDLGEPKINIRVRNILKLIPTNPMLLESYDRIIGKLTESFPSSSSLSSCSLTASASVPGKAKSPSSSAITIQQLSSNSISGSATIQNQSQILQRQLTSQSTPTTPTFSITSDNTNLQSSLFNSFTNTGAAMSSFFSKQNDSAVNLESSSSSSLNSDKKDYNKFFDKSLPLHRILYNLEALGSKLMPTSDETSVQQNTELFRQGFLKSNGLETLISLLKLENFKPNSNNSIIIKTKEYETKQDIYILLLQLLRLIFFGSYYPNNTSTQANEYNFVNKRPSSEPITTCAKKSSIPSNIDQSCQNKTQILNLTNANNYFDSGSNKTVNIIEKMDLNEAMDILNQLLSISWAASAGNVQLCFSSVIESKTEEIKIESDFIFNESSQIKPSSHKEVKFFIQDSNRSSMDSCSPHSKSSQNLKLLQHGICIKQTSMSNQDVKIALKAIEMISCFLHNRKDCISYFLTNKTFSEYIIDVLTGSKSSIVRGYMEKFLLKLCQLEVKSFKCKDFLINLISKSRLPLWGNSSLTRTATQKLILQSKQYFSLRSKLFENMTKEEQFIYSIDLKKMLNDQLTWFIIFSPTRNLKHIDNILLAGHLSLTKALTTCEAVDKMDFGSKIIPILIKTYLFPAAFLISNPSEENSMDPICSDETTRIAAYNLLVELSRNCYSNFQIITKQIIDFHHSQNPSSMSNDWNYIPLVVPRAECGYVGLKNGGATCYMNAILQQLYMMPGVPDYLLSIDTDDLEKNSVFYQLQNVFAHLKESKLEYYIPESFWKALRLWGQEVNIREQQDAYDFFISMTDQIDEYLKKINKEPIFKNMLEGTFSNQFICSDCPHRYEREEAFFGLNLPIKSGKLEESLLQFVKDELLDGDNSYNCEKCNEKRSAIKRTCIKKLPKNLCIQLKRFDYDWESNRSLKFDDFFQFPRTLNVAPYMYESINKVRQTNQNSSFERPNSTSLTDLDSSESFNEDIEIDTNNNNLSQSLPNQFDKLNKDIPLKNEANEILYELVGIVVHSGQANAGHYYSFIKGNDDNIELSAQQELEELEEEDNNVFVEHNIKKKKPYRSETFGKWFKFNDTMVEEIDLNENTLMEECFGGTFTQSSDIKLLPEERVRYWNSYMLFYSSKDINHNKQFQQDVLRNANTRLKRNEKFAPKSTVSGDSLSELTELVSKGDEKGLFRTRLPPSIERLVTSENLEFCKNRTIYDNDYFQFIYELVNISKDISDTSIKTSDNDLFIANSCNLGLEFLYNTFFKTGKKFRTDINKWLDLFKELMSASKDAACTMLNFIVEHETNSNFIRQYLLECPVIEIRNACAELFDYFFCNLIIKFDCKPLDNPKITSLITSFVQLLDKAVIDLCKNSHEYFKVLYNYANLKIETTKQLISLGLFSKLLCFLLGNPGKVKSDESFNRRWNAIQSREFAIVHELISVLILRCNIFSLKTCDKSENQAMDINKDDSKDEEITSESIENEKHQSKFQIPTNTDDLIEISQEIQIYLVGALSSRYLKELVFAFEQINQSLLPKTLEMILTCCHCNETFSGNIIHQILLYVNNSSFNEIKQVLSLLNNIILIEDPLQLKRLQLAIDGYKDDDVVYNGLLSIVRQNQGSDAKKSYQCVKFIVALANTNNTCKDYLLKTAHNWEWSVDWLKKKMVDSNFTNWTMTKSNEDSESRTFQRTKSAQRTLDDATALLKSGTEIE